MNNIIDFTYLGVETHFYTNGKVFSPQAVDQGTMAMLSQVTFTEEDKVLDLGCGYGVVGIVAAKLIGEDKVVLCDISQDAIDLAKKNALLNGLPNAKIYLSNGLNSVEDRDFSLILSNPPYHVDFSVPKSFIEKGYKQLKYGGKMYMVTKRKEWYKNKFISVFGGVKIQEINGYYVFMAEKIYHYDRKYKMKKSEGLYVTFRE